MAQFDFETLQDMVERRVIDIPTHVSAEVPGLVNYGKKRIQEQYNFEVMKATQSANTTVDTRVLAAVAANFKELRKPPYFTTSAGVTVPVGIAVDEEQLRKEYETDAEGFPEFLLRSDPTNDLGASNWHVWPLPNGLSDWTTAPAGEYRLTIPYYKFLDDFADADDRDWFSDNAHMAIVYFATARAFELDWDLEKETAFTAKAMEEIEKVKLFDKRMKFAGHDTLVPEWRGARASGLNRR